MDGKYWCNIPSTISVIKLMRKFQSHGQNRPKKAQHLPYAISQMPPSSNSSILDERARMVRKNLF